MKLTPQTRRVRAQLARRNGGTPVLTEVDAETLTLAREMRFGKLAGQIREVVSGWPQLTEDQRRELASLLHPIP
jgi:hypothetical protein